MRPRRGSVLGIFARRSEARGEGRARIEAAAKTGAAVLGAAVLAVFLGVGVTMLHQRGAFFRLLGTLRDPRVDERTKRDALLGAPWARRARVLEDLPGFASLLTSEEASETDLCDALCAVNDIDLSVDRIRVLLGCGACCEDYVRRGPGVFDNNLRLMLSTMRRSSHHHSRVPELVRRVRDGAKGSGAALSRLFHSTGCLDACKRVVGQILEEDTNIEALTMLAAASTVLDEGSIRLVRITQITKDMDVSVAEIEAIESINSRVFNLTDFTTNGGDDALSRYKKLVLRGQSVLASYMLRVINPPVPRPPGAERAYINPYLSVDGPANATLVERVRVESALSAVTPVAAFRYWRLGPSPPPEFGGIEWKWSSTRDELRSALQKSRVGDQTSGVDRLRVLCFLYEGTLTADALEVRFTPAEYMLIMHEMWNRPLFRNEAYKSAAFASGIAKAYPRGWVQMLETMHIDQSPMYEAHLGSVELDEGSRPMVERLLASTEPGHSMKVWDHVQTLLPSTGVPSASLLMVLASGAKDGASLLPLAVEPRALSETTATAIARTVDRWPVSTKLEPSVVRLLSLLASSHVPVSEAHADAIIESAIRAESGGFCAIARAMRIFAGQDAYDRKIRAMLRAPTPDLVHLVLTFCCYSTAHAIDGEALAAIRDNATLLELVRGKARRNEAGVRNASAAALLVELELGARGGMLYTDTDPEVTEI
jgi:hypothetical protein